MGASFVVEADPFADAGSRFPATRPGVQADALVLERSPEALNEAENLEERASRPL